MDQSVVELIRRSAVVPSMPQVLTRFMKVAQDSNCDYGELVEILSADAGTAGEILRLSNSSLFGVARQVTSLQRAMALLGLKRVRSVVQGRFVVDGLGKKRFAGVDTSYFWRRSVTTAVLADRLAEALAPGHQEEAFISGLLADVGVLILNDVYFQRYQAILAQYTAHGRVDIATMEEEQIGVTHAQATAVALEHWQLPDPVCEAIRRHPWETSTPQDPPLARIVGAADRIGKYLCESPNDLGVVAEDCRRIMENLGSSDSELAGILGEIEFQIEEFARVLRVNALCSPVHTPTLQALRDLLVAPPPVLI